MNVVDTNNQSGNGIFFAEAESCQHANVSMSANVYSKEIWLMDSGATQHMMAHHEWFSTYEKFEHPVPIKLGDNNVIYTQGKGNVGIHLHGKVKESSGIFADILYTPDIGKNLFLIGRMMA